MSKKALKEQHPWANVNYIDYLSFLDPSKTNKFLPFMIKELKRSIEERNERNRNDVTYMVREIAQQFRIDETVLYGKDYDMLVRINGILDMFGSDKVNISLSTSAVVNIRSQSAAAAVPVAMYATSPVVSIYRSPSLVGVDAGAPAPVLILMSAGTAAHVPSPLQ